MSKKLLNKTLKVYILFSLIVLLISAPLFYLLADKLFIDDADEALLLRKKEFEIYNLKSLKIPDIAIWNKFNRDVKIEERTSKISDDTIFYAFFVDSLANENEPYRVLRSPVIIEHKPFMLMARINLVESEDMIKSIALLFLLMVSSLLIGLFFITKRLSNKLWKPFYSTLDQVEKFELDKNITPEFENNDIDEFIRLNQSVKRLLERNVATYKNQKEFIENAAHELQTPLASFQAKLDTLAQQLPFTDELGKILSDLNNAVSQLNRINKNLLLLSKIENNQYPALEEVNVSDKIKRLVIFFTEQAGEKKISLTIKYIEPLTIKANPILLEIAINNLLLNAVRHTHNSGKINVYLNAGTLSVANTSSSLALDTETLYQRFSNRGSAGGNGLGLAIVKRINDMHAWNLNYKHEENMHIFQLNFEPNSH